MAEADPQKTFNVHEAKTQFSRLVDRAHAGEEIVVAKAGVPWVRLVPYAVPTKVKRRPGGWPLAGDIPDSVWFDPMPEEELALWEGERLEKHGL